jgi:basic amino acid/polyamine antiporter, APA family
MSQAPTRKLGLAAATSIVVGESVALGIFLTPASMARDLGSPLLLAAVWLGMGLMTFAGALCYAELAVRFPESGGGYIYLREGFGERMAFLYGWMSATVLDPGVAAAMAVGSVPYIAQLVTLSPRQAAWLPAAILIGFAIVNSAGTRISGHFVSFVNFFKLALLFALVAFTAFSGHAHLANLQPFATRLPGSEPIFAALVSAIVAAFFSFGGWWQAGNIAGEVRNYQRNMPLAFTAGVSVVTLIYLLVSFSFLAVVPMSEIHSNTAFVAQFGRALFGAAGGRILSACVIVAVMGGLGALTMAAPRVYAAMARDGSFFPVFAKTHSRFGTPVAAIWLQTALALVAVWLGAFDRILAYVIFSALVILALITVVLFRINPPVRKFWFPVAPIIFIAGCLVIALLILMHDPLPALLGIAIVLAGEPLRRWFIAPALRRGRATEPERN